MNVFELLKFGSIFSKLIFEGMKGFVGICFIWLSMGQIHAQSSFMASQRQFPKVVNALKLKEDSLKKQLAEMHISWPDRKSVV